MYVTLIINNGSKFGEAYLGNEYRIVTVDDLFVQGKQMIEATIKQYKRADYKKTILPALEISEKQIYK
jgi:hypothetical protein